MDDADDRTAHGNADAFNLRRKTGNLLRASIQFMFVCLSTPPKRIAGTRQTFSIISHLLHLFVVP